MYGFLRMDCLMDLSKVLHGFVKVVMWICQSCFMYFSPFAIQNQTEVWPGFQSFLKHLLWTKGLGRVKVLYASGLGQCLYFIHGSRLEIFTFPNVLTTYTKLKFSWIIHTVIIVGSWFTDLLFGKIVRTGNIQDLIWKHWKNLEDVRKLQSSGRDGKVLKNLDKVKKLIGVWEIFNDQIYFENLNI